MSAPITAAAIISFSERLQEVSAAFYRDLGEAYPAHRRLFEGYVQRCDKDKVQIVRTYRETVTDALETNYSFEGLVVPEGLLEAPVPAGDWGAALEQAVALEAEAAAFYEEVAARSEGLLATIPRAYRRVAARRRAQEAELRGLQST
jgi:hypothetical protein